MPRGPQDVGSKDSSFVEGAMNLCSCRRGTHAQAQCPYRSGIILSLHGAEPRNHIFRFGVRGSHEAVAAQPLVSDDSDRHLPFVDDDLAALENDLRLQKIPVAFERIAVEKNDVGNLAGFERAELVAHLDV